MSLLNAYTQIKVIMAADADLLNWLTTHSLGASFTQIGGARRIETINNDEYPCQLFELVDGDYEPPELGGDHQYVDDGFEMAFGWYENDQAAALEQRMELADLVPKIIMNNPTLNDSVGEARVESYEPDRSVYHPYHFMNFVIKFERQVLAA